ncbi:aminopeptidase P family protein [Bernardetia sp. Wsw4-3y2]|uniref:aminopeptidase P family protein n=1 Tax=Bernardetia sp. Wsw4-3y2 TaxID=3127471 RepID=UPI0030CB4B90
MRHEPIKSNLFVKNRKKFTKGLLSNSIAIFNSNDIMPTSADGTMPFVQHSDIYYLTGIDQEETILVLFPDAKEEKYREVLFVKETNDHIKVWEGEKLTKEAATKQSGIQTVFWTSQFWSILQQFLIFPAQNVYLTTNEHTRQSVEVETRDDRFRKEIQHRFPLHTYQRSAPILQNIRAIKEKTEIELMRHACSITEKGFRRLLSFVKPNVMEYEIEAELLHEFVRNRSKGFAYEPIIAAGENSCVLHYVQNDNICKKGDIILLDIGAEYAGYASDMSRTIPVSGKYTKRQKEVYNAVLRVQRAAMKLLNPSNTLNEYHKEVGNLMEKELIGLGLLDKKEVKNQDPNNPLYKQYFMHGTTHHLGINVHDYGAFDRKIEAGMVFTVEPGIYIPKEKIGIRLENDIVITKNGYDDLMGNIPIEVEEIEDLMNKK